MKRKLLLLVNVDWFFISHRLEIGLAAINKGLEVHVACQDTGKCNYLETLGFKVHRLALSRSKRSPFSEFFAFREIYKLVKNIRPSILHSITIKPVLYGCIVARWLEVPLVVASISGLGYVFTDSRFRVRALRLLIICVYRYALARPLVKVIFQNMRDKNLFLKTAIIQADQVQMIRGSGANLSQYVLGPEPEDVPVILFLARLLVDKGLKDFVDSARLVNANGVKARFVVAGGFDIENPNAVNQQELDTWVSDGVIEYWGFSTDAASTILKSSVMVLPSFYAEGLPKSLIEAAACGRAVITTDMPGCRDAIEPGVTGLLVPAKDPQRLAEAIEYLIDNPEVRERMGKEGRRLAEEAFDVLSVVQKHMVIYGLEK